MVGELTWPRRIFGLWIPLAALFLFALFPFAWMAATSLKAASARAYPNEWTSATPRSNAACCLASQETGKCTLPRDSCAP